MRSGTTTPEIMIEAFELVRLGEGRREGQVPRHVQRLLLWRSPTPVSLPAWTGWSCCWPARTPSVRSSLPHEQKCTGSDDGCPSTVSQKQLDELHIVLVEPEA